MNIITTEQLATTLLKEIFEDLYDMWFQAHGGQSLEDVTTFDDWLFSNKELLGNAVYQVIGDRYGDADDMIDEIL